MLLQETPVRGWYIMLHRKHRQKFRGNLITADPECMRDEKYLYNLEATTLIYGAVSAKG